MIALPATDVGHLPLNWTTFNNAHRRIQNGGWAREVTQSDFAIADTISGINMRLTSGGIREMHWHQFAEWAYVTYGNCRITVLDDVGRPYIADVKHGDSRQGRENFMIVGGAIFFSGPTGAMPNGRCRMIGARNTQVQAAWRLRSRRATIKAIVERRKAAASNEKQPPTVRVGSGNEPAIYVQGT